MATAVLAMMTAMTACTTANDDNPLPEPGTQSGGNGGPFFTMSINPKRTDYTAATRGLTAMEDDASISASFLPDLPIRVFEVFETDAGDGMTMVNELFSGDLMLDTKNSGNRYVGDVFLRNPVTSTLNFYYDYTFYPNSSVYLPTDYSNQKGTLEDISANFDYAIATLSPSDFKFNGGSVTSSNDSLTFTNQQAIAKFHFEDQYGNALYVTGLTVSTISQSFSATLDTLSTDVYMALPSIQNTNVTLTATAIGAEYKTSLKKQSFKRGQYYPMTLTFERKSAGKIDLSKLTSHITLMDGDELTGTLDGTTQRVKLTIADGATVTLNNAQILGAESNQYQDQWAGITCAGNATIILKGTNQVVTFNRYRAAIQAGPVGSTLTIKGDGNLTVGRTENHICETAIGASSDSPCGNILIEGGNITATAGVGAGIGSTDDSSCGNITITGGNVTAFGAFGPAIGCSLDSSCGDITITGGSIFAQGGDGQTGIGSSYGGSCGNITISCSTSFISVKAIKDNGSSFAIGPTYNDYFMSQCGTITFDGEILLSGTDYTEYNPQNGDYGSLHLEKTTTRLGDEDLRPGNEDCYDDNTWTLTPILSN